MKIAVHAGLGIAILSVMWLVLQFLAASSSPTWQHWWNAKAVADPLDEVLLRLSSKDALTVRHIQNGGAICIGGSGSGKTSGPGEGIHQALIDLPGSGGLILASKDSDREDSQRRFAKAGRSDDLLIFGPRSNLKLNFIDAEMKHGGHTRNVVQIIKILSESTKNQANKDSHDAYFEELETRIIHHAVEIVKLATGKVTAPDLQKLITTAPYSTAQIATPEWTEGYCNRFLKAAFEKPKSEIEQHDCELAMQFFLQEFPTMADKTRSSALAGVMSTLFCFNTGVVRQLVSGETNLSLEVLEQGKWILVDMPPCEYGVVGQFVCCGLKFLTERFVLSRKAPRNLIAISGDECHQFINSWDSHFISQCRSHRGCLIFLTQCLASLYGAVPGPAGKHQIDALLSNFQHKFITTLADEQTAEWCGKLIGRRKETFYGASMAPEKDVYDELFGSDRVTASFSEHYENIVQNNLFLRGLRCGGKANNYIVDCVVIRNGEPFSNGESHLITSFKQR